MEKSFKYHSAKAQSLTTRTSTHYPNTDGHKTPTQGMLFEMAEKESLGRFICTDP